MNQQTHRPRRVGRPSLYSKEILDEICARLSNAETLSGICRDPHMPDRRTVWDWEERIDGVSSQLARARERGFDRMAEDCISIADDPNDDPHSRRVRVDTRLKLLGKWCPKRFGDRVELEHNAGESQMASLRAWLAMSMAKPIVRPAAPLLEDGEAETE